MVKQPHSLPCTSKCSDRGDGRCHFCGFTIREEIPQPHKEPLPQVSKELPEISPGTAGPKPQDCPDPLCILDIPDSTVCLDCPRKPKPHPGWGGRRAGAGAPTFNLNRLKHGQQSKLLKKGIEQMAEDPLMRAVLLIIARLAHQGEVPPQTRKAIQAAMRKRGVSYDES